MPADLGGDQRRFQLLVESITDHAIYMLDPEGVVLSWNPAAERIKAYRADQIIGRNFQRFFTTEDQQAGIPTLLLARARREGRAQSEGWRVRKDGTRFWASATVHAIREEDGRLVGYAKITRDMTEQREAARALAESERRFRLLVESVIDYALFMIDPNGIVTNWNTGAQHIKGYSAEEIIGQHISRFYTDTDRASGVPIRALQTATETGKYESEGWRVRKDGNLFWASVVIDAIRDETGKLIGFAKITRDITERRKAQMELQKAHEQLAQVQKMDAIGQLTGGVAHDFNNLLMVIGGQAELLRTRLGGADPRATRSLDAIETATRRGRDLTRHLLSFARRQHLQPLPISLSDRIRGIEELFRASLPAPVALMIDVPSFIWPVEVDPSEFEIALLNMIVNARDALPDGGVVSITGENVTLREGEIQDLSGDFATLTIRDSGTGMPPDIRERVFEPFFTTKGVNKGTGLGLSQVYGFVHQAGGHISVTSELGKGTSFTIYLPRVQATPVAPSEPREVDAPAGLNVLVVEDNPEVAEVAAALLEQLGNRVRVVSSGTDALADMADGNVPDVLFSDIVMSGEFDGIALGRRVRELYPNLPVLLATGYAQTAERVGDEFPILHKPYELADLNRALGLLLANSPASTAATLRKLRVAT
ncbi:PAS domain S-box protein [Roseiterribacter gracilis]